MRQFALTLCLLLAATSQLFAAESELSWSELPPVPEELGLAGPFVGVHNDALILAGGANFPRPVWDTKKVWHDTIFVMTKAGDTYKWTEHGKLPRPIAYGAAVSTKDGIVCMGGNDADKTYDDVLLLSWNPATEQVTTTAYPSLPMPCAFTAATIINDVIYLAGGQSRSSLDSAMTNFWSLDLSKKSIPEEFVWHELPSWPGPTRAFNLTVSQHNGYNDCVYVISGRRQEGDADDPASYEFLKDVWEYNPTTNSWRRRADVPRCVMAGSGISYGQSHIFVLSGATEELFFQTDELKDQHPGFINTAARVWLSMLFRGCGWVVCAKWSKIDCCP